MFTVREIPLQVITSKIQEVRLPLGSIILNVGPAVDTHDKIQLWVLCRETPGTELRYFTIVPTGAFLNHDVVYSYVGTMAEGSGILPWHVFEVRYD